MGEVTVLRLASAVGEARPSLLVFFLPSCGTPFGRAHQIETMKLGYHNIQNADSTQPVFPRGHISVCGDRLEGWGVASGSDNPG